jgi:hypothetical protein
VATVFEQFSYGLKAAARPVLRQLVMKALSLLVLVMVSTPVLAQTDTASSTRITINGRKLSGRDLQTIRALERTTGRKAIAGDYWYDNATGALGRWGGPTLLFLSAGLGLGGALPANASGGGDGFLTGVFINGRELHPVDVQGLTSMLRSPPMPGRWWVDAMGNCGVEGGPAMFNLFALARQNGGNGSSYFRKYDNGNSTSVSKGCASVHGSLGSGDDKRDYSYFVGCE